MAKSYKPSSPFSVPMKLLIPTVSKSKGVSKKTYPDPSEVEEVFFGSFRTFGGSESFENNLLTVIDTAQVETWYRPDITSDCRIYLCDTGEEWDVISRPENIAMRNQYLQFKVQKVGGAP